MGATGPAGPPGCAIGSTCTSALSPISVNGTKFADSFAGADVQAKVAAAFAASAGTSGSPAESALVNLAPGTHYVYSSPIEIPNQTSPPYIIRPILDCNGSTLTYTGSGAQPAILVRGENVDNSASSGELRNCTVLRADATGPVMQENDRMGWHMTNMMLQGGQDSYVVNLTTTDGGPGYREEGLFDNVAYVYPARDAIRVVNGSGGNGGFQYNYGRKLRFEFQNDGHAQIHFVGSINALNGDWQTTVNTGGDGTTYFLQADAGSVVLSTKIEFNGEATSGAMLFKIGGGGIVDLNCLDLSRTPLAYDFNGACHTNLMKAGSGSGIYGQISGFTTRTAEPNFENGDRATRTTDDGTNWIRWHPNKDGVEGLTGSEHIVSCLTSASHPEVVDSTTCVSQEYHRGNGGFGFGAGYGPTGIQPSMKLETSEDYGSIVPTTANSERHYWEQNGGVWQFVHQFTLPPPAGGQPQCARRRSLLLRRRYPVYRWSKDVLPRRWACRYHAPRQHGLRQLQRWRRGRLERHLCHRRRQALHRNRRPGHRLQLAPFLTAFPLRLHNPATKGDETCGCSSGSAWCPANPNPCPPCRRRPPRPGEASAAG